MGRFNALVTIPLDMIAVLHIFRYSHHPIRHEPKRVKVIDACRGMQRGTVTSFQYIQ